MNWTTGTELGNKPALLFTQSKSDLQWLRYRKNRNIITSHSIFLETSWWLAPWRIGTLKYLEIKIEEWPSRAKWGQSGPNGAKWCQMMPNRVKRGKTGSNGAKRGQKEPYGAKLGQKGQTGQTRPNGVKWG